MSQAKVAVDYAPPQTPQAAPSLGTAAGRGFAWMLGQTLVSKLLSVGAQIVLAWYLVRADMGLVGLALAVASFPSLLRDAGLQQILVQRQVQFRRWSIPAFWMSLALGVVSGLLMAAIAPIATHVLRAPGLTGLLLLQAAASPLTALATVPAARVQIDLRYRFQAALALVMSIVSVTLNIVLARLHFGAYAIIFPLVLANVLRTVVLWVESPVRISRHLRIRRWRYLTGDSGLLLGTTAFMMLVANGDYLIVGYFCGSEAVGIFYFAFNLSMQTLALLMVNLANVLFPALSKLQAERPRQIEAYLRASRVFAAIAVPFCLMQAAGSDAGFRLIFKPIWYPSIPVLQILSVAMAIRTTAIPAQALTAAQNRLRYSLNIAVAYSIVFLAIVALAARFGGPHAVIWVALAELVHFGITDPLYMYLLMRMNGRGVREVFHVFKAPLIAGSIAALIAGGVSHVFPAGLSRSWQLPRLLAVVCVMVVVYVPLLRLLSAELWQELVERVRALRAKA